MDKKFKWELFNTIPVIGIMRHFQGEYLKKTVAIYQQCGLTTLEITLNSKDALVTIKQLVEEWGDKMNIGAGTVCSVADLDAALTAGAQFIVSPIVNEDVIKKCVGLNIPVFPGAFTPTEVYKAWSLGAPMIKLFPARNLVPSYIKDILGPLDKVELIATGGVSTKNFTEFLAAGAKGVGIASELFPKSIIENEKWDELQHFFSKIVDDYNQYKQFKK